MYHMNKLHRMDSLQNNETHTEHNKNMFWTHDSQRVFGDNQECILGSRHFWIIAEWKTIQILCKCRNACVSQLIIIQMLVESWHPLLPWRWSRESESTERKWWFPTHFQQCVSRISSHSGYTSHTLTGTGPPLAMMLDLGKSIVNVLSSSRLTGAVLIDPHWERSGWSFPSLHSCFTEIICIMHIWIESI